MDGTLPSKIKLVIWDLDDTFWDGTLTEGGIAYRRDRHELVVSLARRGVLNSICSNNDPDQARARLTAEGIWDYFVFADLDWGRKGARVARLVEEAQLRAENVVFVDDRPANLDEVRLAAPGICCVLPDCLLELASRLLSEPESDPQLSRLARYKLLESKRAERGAALARGVDEVDFLRSTRIVVQEVSDLLPHLERIHELVDRTNQLNFTLRRSSLAEVERMLRDDGYRCGAVRVSDRYGDYGIVGFWALRDGNDEPPALEHFLFSCRVLNMGIEAWAYERLGRPRVETERDVTEMESWRAPTWIEVRSPVTPASAPLPTPATNSDGPCLRVFMKGGCMLDGLLAVMEQRADVDTEVVAEIGQWSSHSLAMRLAGTPDGARWRSLVERWCASAEFVETGLFAPGYDLVILELSKDTRCGLYDVGGGLLLPIAPVGFDMTSAACREALALWKTFPMSQGPGPWNADPIYDDEGLAWLASRGRPLGDEVRRERVEENLRYVVRRVAESSPGATTVLLVTPSLPAPRMFPCWAHVPEEARHVERIARHVAAELERVVVLSIGTFMSGSSDFMSPSPFIVNRAACERIFDHVWGLARPDVANADRIALSEVSRSASESR